MNEIILGNCEDVLKTIHEESVHLTCTSPPYYNAKSYSTWPNYEDYLQFLDNVFQQVFRVTKSGRMCLVNLSPVIKPLAFNVLTATVLLNVTLFI